VFCFVLQRTPTNENDGGTEWQGIQQLLLSFFYVFYWTSLSETLQNKNEYPLKLVPLISCVDQR